MSVVVCVNAFGAGSRVTGLEGILPAWQKRLKAHSEAVHTEFYDMLRTFQLRVFAKVKDGVTYFVESSSDGHTLQWMSGMDRGNSVTPDGRFLFNPDTMPISPYARRAPWYPLLQHQTPDMVHIQREDTIGRAKTSMFDDLIAPDALPLTGGRRVYPIAFSSFLMTLRWWWIRYGTVKMVPRRLDLQIAADFRPLLISEFRKTLPGLVVRAEVTAGVR